MIPTGIPRWCDAKSCLLALLLLLVFEYRRRRRRKESTLPPGPWVLPLLNEAIFGFNHHTIGKIAEKYGNIFSIRRGGTKMVCVSGYVMVREVLIGQGDNFLDRPVPPLSNEVFKGNGISVSNGYRWRRQRHFSISHINRRADSNRSLECNILQECALLCESIQAEIGRSFDPQDKVSRAVANVMGKLVFGKQLHGSSDFQHLLHLSAESSSLVRTPLAQLYDICPRLMQWLPGPREAIISNYAQVVAFLKRQIHLHKMDWDPFHHRDFIDSYIGEIDKRSNDMEAGFRVENLAFCTLDMLQAGTETMASTLRWALLFMVKYPSIQEEVQAEIDRVLGRLRPPSLADRFNLPYVNAVLHETQRLGNVLPLNMPRVTRRDTMLGGFLIPEGTLVVTSLSSVLRDKTQWDTPYHFNPNHFLDNQGGFRKHQAFFAFSAGKRMCLGEQLAQMELFLFFTSLLQRFRFTPAEGTAPMSTEAIGTSVHSPKPFHVQVTLRV